MLSIFTVTATDPKGVHQWTREVTDAHELEDVAEAMLITFPGCRIEYTSLNGPKAEYHTRRSSPPEDNVRVLRLIEYRGPRAAVEKQIANSLHGQKVYPGGKSGGVCTITAATIGLYPEIMKTGGGWESE